MIEKIECDGCHKLTGHFVRVEEGSLEKVDEKQTAGLIINYFNLMS